MDKFLELFNKGVHSQPINLVHEDQRKVDTLNLDNVIQGTFFADVK